MQTIQQLSYEVRVFGWRNPVRRFLNHCIDALGRPGNFVQPDSSQGPSFEVQGAGTVHFSTLPTHRTRIATGFSFSVSWGNHGYAGGVIDAKEAKRMAEYILNTVHREVTC